MKLYRIVAAAPTGKETRWAGSQADAATARKTFNQTGHKRDAITTEEVEVPTDKKGLLNWLNEQSL